MDCKETWHVHLAALRKWCTFAIRGRMTNTLTAFEIPRHSGISDACYIKAEARAAQHNRDVLMDRHPP